MKKKWGQAFPARPTFTPLSFLLFFPFPTIAFSPFTFLPRISYSSPYLGTWVNWLNENKRKWYPRIPLSRCPCVHCLFSMRFNLTTTTTFLHPTHFQEDSNDDGMGIQKKRKRLDSRSQWGGSPAKEWRGEKQSQQNLLPFVLSLPTSPLSLPLSSFTTGRAGIV